MLPTLDIKGKGVEPRFWGFYGNDWTTETAKLVILSYDKL